MNATGRTHRAPLALLLWAALLLFGQTAGLAHAHADDLPDTSCAACSLAKADIAAGDTPPAVAGPELEHRPAPHPPVANPPAPHARPYQSRAPPRG